ncbi:unnamed protein product [Colletotrichum noveboracense]|uniref:Heterokaryon incompatibility domain-containing protein n=1 Tax=Colletotrichum noveboracense TaxID=2664923 RepID=A0A9W4WGB9_9PEZI|nr:unnamed protein product [Colletotrichum noveboracense]
MPTRLLDVSNSQIRLVDTQNSQGQYLALSHPWGDPKSHFHFCTYNHNIEKHQERIVFDALPATFKDAITTTRELGFQYLWIDSLCIVQGADGDFAEQSKQMEEVFSSAHCVLAASRSTGQSDGFLGMRPERDYVTFDRNGDTYHVCEGIDHFQRDVIDGPLNKRGWVLQERAVARRTVYFTEAQTYWECGGGVRCETFTRLKNDFASFLGDPKFPDFAMRSTRGEKIRLYQIFYSQYSRLEFTRIEDRPFAIIGLEKRLIQAFNARGGYGILDDGEGLLYRSLLWRRPSNGTLEKIKFPPERNISIPTWSWMAYKGGIDYFDPLWNGFEWEQSELQSPWTTDTSAGNTSTVNNAISFNVTVRNFDLEDGDKKHSKLFFDMLVVGERPTSGLKCVVIARPKAGVRTIDRRCYVLLVTPQSSSDHGGVETFERVGVGYIPESCISQDKTSAKLQ